jgi:hypothetical protein
LRDFQFEFLDSFVSLLDLLLCLFDLVAVRGEFLSRSGHGPWQRGSWEAPL